MDRHTTGNGLKIGHFVNAFNALVRELSQPFPSVPYQGLALGYLEACLVNFGVIESKENGVEDYALEIETKILWFKNKRKEDRKEIVLRLSKKFLTDNNLL